MLALDGEPLADWQDLVDRVRALPGETITLRVERDGQAQDVQLTLASRGDGEARTGYLGAGVQGVEWPPEMLREVRYGRSMA